MRQPHSETSPLIRLVQSLLILAVLLSFTVELTSASYNSEVSILMLEDIGNDSDSHGDIDFEIDSEVEKSPSRDHSLPIDWHLNDVSLEVACNLGLSNAKSPIQQLDAPPPQV